ncbi:endo alpha-1,4 polygalactosaminidase [Streptomyces sp. NPDC004134]|uniref:endo alpha-1,4 polygalactosaminidase n=1 Tax=Streptomyces sp. NPDC004134 TaxID=3364691 RepID=UPI0036741162
MTDLPALASTARRVLTFAVVAVLATACMTRPDGRDEDRWQPRPGEAADWDWQIDAPYDLDEHRAMYDLDLFELAPAGSELRYPGGDVVKVPRGALAGTIGKLQARGTVVICYLDTGAYEHYRPDAARFPGHRPAVAAIPDDGEPPEDGSVIGWNTGWEGERWLDIREGRREAFAEIIWARLDLAARMGCDGVEPDQNNPLGNRPGFPITRDDQVSWYREVAEQAHARGLSVGMKNGHDQPGAVAELVDHFDWALPEECAQYGECARLRPFVEAGKAVFAVDYAPGVDRRTGCRAHRAENFDGLIKTAPPTGEHRVQCR